MKHIRTKTTLLILTFFLSIFLSAGCSPNKSWRTARRDSAGIEPVPSKTKEAIIHVYGADAWSWRGWFAIHTWIATKRTGESSYTVYDVVGWRARHGKPVMMIQHDLPDRYWFGSKPQLLKELRGH